MELVLFYQYSNKFSLLIGENIKSSFRREEIEESNRIIYCIMQEIKYNMTLEEVIQLTNTGDFKLDNYDEFLLDLSSLDLGQCLRR